MDNEKPFVEVCFNNMRINTILSNSGVFAGSNLQHLWCSDSTIQTGFGLINGEGNFIESPCNTVTDPDSSSEMLEYFEELARLKIGKRGI